MKRRLLVFADGTWNKPESDSTNTNVFEMFKKIIPEKCANGDEQICFYHEGVGTGNKWNQFFGGAFGKGIEDNIKLLYQFIVEHYQPETEIYLFGFSRGAYTVRSLAGLINNCGILKKHNQLKVDRAFFIYRSREKKYHPNEYESQQFRQHFSHPISTTSITFMGVWDTVGSLGIPLKFNTFISRNKYTFHDVKLNSLIKNAYHAIAIDETRAFFRPTLWAVKANNHIEGRVAEQCWFRGVHSDIGGGYEINKELAKLPLHYFIIRAQSIGLQINYSINIDELKQSIYIPRNESRTGFYKLIPPFYRVINSKPYRPKSRRDKFNSLLLSIILKHDKTDLNGYITNEFVHESVIDWCNVSENIPNNLKYVLSDLPIIKY